ncbi:hypothetical protein CGT98_17220 [Vibrio metoecus]|uniref:hypothetical protein n=1 Tax=Vibrio metoecus TaxID=1481663 RepID=UPI000BA90B0D|nr:hypothetical protein [Vibrio metoecus]PAR36947.1 hypothetical protein CGT98_17220 [Vibrio metoecus]
MKRKNFESLKQVILPEGLEKVTDEILNQTYEAIPKGELSSFELVGFQMRSINDQWSSGFSYEMGIKDSWAVGTVNLLKRNDKWYVSGFRVIPAKESKHKKNKFTNFEITYF